MLLSLNERTTGKDIKEEVLICVNAHQPHLRDPIGIVTDVALSIIGKNSAAVTLILRHVEALNECPSSERKIFICHFFCIWKTFSHKFWICPTP